MAKITFLLGLAGSGKTYLAEKIQQEDGGEIFEGVEHHKSWPQIIDCLNNGINCIIEEIAYCHPNSRDFIMQQYLSSIPNLKIEWICYENNLESANWNVQHRDKGDVDGHLKSNQLWHKLYVYPEQATLITITRI